MSEEKNLKQFLKGIAQNECLLPSLCCSEGLTPFPEHTAQCSPFSESGMEAKVSPTSTERSSGRATAHSEHSRVLPSSLFGASGLATDFFPKNFKILLVALWVTPACPKGDHSWSGVLRIMLGQVWGRH